MPNVGAVAPIDGRSDGATDKPNSPRAGEDLGKARRAIPAAIWITADGMIGGMFVRFVVGSDGQHQRS
jgi:hypothetical protein